MRRSTRRWLACVVAWVWLAAPFGASPALAAGANYQGLWWNPPAESGWGINFAHQGDVIFATWFTYNGRGEPWWLIAELHRTVQGGYTGDVWTVTGPAFNAVPFDPARVAETAVGRMSVTFDSPAQGRLAYTVNGISQTKPIVKQVFGPEPICAWGQQPDLARATNYQDLWWNPAESGWGVNFTHQGDIIFATWFTYDASRKPWWLIAELHRTPAGTYAGKVSTVKGPAFDSVPFDGSKVVETFVGDATVTFADGNRATFAYTVNGTTQAKAVTRQVFVAPGTVCTSPPPPLTTADAWRLLNQATFGASQAELARLMKLGIAGWIDDQFDRPVSGYPDSVYNRIQLKQTVDCGTKDAAGANYLTTAPEYICWRDHLTPTGLQRNFFTNAVRSSDQLRQRVAWALSQIHVVSTTEADLAVAYPMARYQNLLFEEAFGNFERLLQKVTLSPAMGNYLDMVNNDKPNATTGRVPNENYAREVLQLFAIGLVELGSDGRPLTDAAGKAVATYDQDDIKQFARAFTGWTYPKADGTATTAKNTAYYAAPMVPYPNGHDVDAKALLEGQTLAAGRSALQDTQDAVRNIFLHPNVGPFIGRQLIQRLVTGDPSPAYVARVAAAFNDNGAGVRGDMKAVVRTILTDPEARGPAKTDPRFGQLREPVLMITGLLRAMNGVSDGKGLADMAAGLGQRPYASPSVFNYFPPDHTIPGTDILGPEFAIHTSSSAVARANRVYDLVYSGIAVDATVPAATGTRFDILPFEAQADNAAALVDGVSDALVGGPLPAAARDIVITAVNAIPVTGTTFRTDRARMAVYLIASSFHFQVQR